ncbi:MAG: hypothetical protein IKR42_06675, partial [Campylobacter sp.]|nr:hypothetical protein [Campylobacter sp.]
DWAEKFWEFRDKKEEKNPADSADKDFMRYFDYISEMLFYKEKENFKNEIDKNWAEIFRDFVDKSEKENRLSHYFKYKIYRDWAKLFWNYRDENKKEAPVNNTNEAFKRYFDSKIEYKNEETKKDKKTDEIDINKALKVYEKQENIVFLFRALNKIKEIQEKCENIFSDEKMQDKICIFDEFDKSLIKKLFDKENKDLANHKKILLFTVIYGICNGVDNEKLKDILRLVRNLSNSAKYCKGGDVKYTKNFRTSAFGWVINEVIVKFLKNSAEFKINSQNSPNEISKYSINQENIKLNFFSDENYKKAIIEFENHRYLKGDLINFINENTALEEFCKNKNAIEEIFKLDDYKIVSVLLCFQKNKTDADKFSIQNFYPYYIGWSSGSPKYHFGKKEYWEIILTDKENKIIFENLIKEFTNQESIEKIIDNFKNNLTTKNWLYYFLQYNEIFFGEINNNDLVIKDEFSNVFKWDTWEKVKICGYNIEKMSGARISNSHINPYLYTALKDFKNVEFENTTENDFSYAKIENFIEKISCLDDGWHIKFAKNDISNTENKFDLKRNTDEFILAHDYDPNSDTIKNLQKLLENLKTLA